MRHLLICASLISATGFAPAALAEADYYVKGGLSYSAPAEQDETNFNITEWDFENGLGFQGAIGHQYSETLAVELELQYKSFDAQERTESGTIKTGLGGDLTYTSLMLNGYYTPQLESQSDIFNPYLGAGVGISKVKWDSITVDGFSGEIDDSDTVAAFQLMLGNRFNLSEMLLSLRNIVTSVQLITRYLFLILRPANLITATTTPL